MTTQKGNTRNQYEAEFKKEMVHLLLEEGRTIQSVNEEFHLVEGTVREWIKQFRRECAENPQTNDLAKLYEESHKLRKELAEGKFILKKSRRILRKGSQLEKYQFIDDHKGTYGPRWLLKHFGIYPNAYYNYRQHRKAPYQAQKGHRQALLMEIYHEYCGRPGYRIMNIYLKRDFHADTPNRKWCTDFTYLFLSDGAKRYNCNIIDLYDRSAVASVNGRRIDTGLAEERLKKALEKNPSAAGSVVLHSDQGSQFTSQRFTEYCKKRQIRQSMSRAGCPYDNAPIESFYETFKAELTKQHSFEDDEQLNRAVSKYVYCYYNHVRPHSANGYMTPFEKRHAAVD